MATFKVVVRKKRADGFYPVYIRVVHRSRMGYIKTDKLITDKQITKNGEIKDIVVNEYCSREILRYSDMINRKDVSNYSVAELIEFLIHSDEEICFSDYATKFINRMASEGHERNAKNYRLAVNHLERYLGTTRVMFTHLSSSVLTRWINSLSLTNRAKEMYPTCLRQIFKRALIELNDEERGIVRIKYNPWLKHRQLNMFVNAGAKIARSTLYDWCGTAIDALEGLYYSIRSEVLKGNYLNIDETTISVIDEDVHHAKKEYMWGLVNTRSK